MKEGDYTSAQRRNDNMMTEKEKQTACNLELFFVLHWNRKLAIWCNWLKGWAYLILSMYTPWDRHRIHGKRCTAFCKKSWSGIRCFWSSYFISCEFLYSLTFIHCTWYRTVFHMDGEEEMNIYCSVINEVEIF